MPENIAASNFQSSDRRLDMKDKIVIPTTTTSLKLDI